MPANSACPVVPLPCVQVPPVHNLPRCTKLKGRKALLLVTAVMMTLVGQVISDECSCSNSSDVVDGQPVSHWTWGIMHDDTAMIGSNTFPLHNATAMWNIDAMNAAVAAGIYVPQVISATNHALPNHHDGGICCMYIGCENHYVMLAHCACSLHSCSTPVLLWHCCIQRGHVSLCAGGVSFATALQVSFAYSLSNCRHSV